MRPRTTADDQMTGTVQGLVREIRETDLTLDNGDKMEYGLCIWSTGVGPTTFTTALPFAKTARGRIAVDDCQRVLRQIHPSGKAAEPSCVDDVRAWIGCPHCILAWPLQLLLFREQQQGHSVLHSEKNAA